MGWLNLGARLEISLPSQCSEGLACAIQKIESISLNSRDLGVTDTYHIVSTNIPDENLPFITPDEVKKRKSADNGALFIVVDNIVYDCTYFLREHPGGEQIIKSFGGADCSWQFWRFHGKKEIEDFGKALRVGRTNGMVNRFQEPQKYVGLKRLGHDEWD